MIATCMNLRYNLLFVLFHHHILIRDSLPTFVPTFVPTSIMTSIRKNDNSKLVSECHSRKIYSDLDPKFLNVTYCSGSDVTILHRCDKQTSKSRNIMLFGGIEGSILNTYPYASTLALENNVFLVTFQNTSSVRDMMDCIIPFVKAKRLKNMIVVGESFGAIPAFALCKDLKARNLRTYIDHVIVINPATSYLYSRLPMIVQNMKSDLEFKVVVFFTMFLHGSAADSVLQNKISKEGMRALIYMYTNMITLTIDTLYKRVKLLIEGIKYIEDYLPSHTIRTTIIVGDSDVLLPSLEEAQRLQILLEKSKVVQVIVKNSGHILSCRTFNITNYILG